MPISKREKARGETSALLWVAYGVAAGGKGGVRAVLAR